LVKFALNFSLNSFIMLKKAFVILLVRIKITIKIHLQATALD
jgi:hypothetical protein